MRYARYLFDFFVMDYKIRRTLATARRWYGAPRRTDARCVTALREEARIQRIQLDRLHTRAAAVDSRDGQRLRQSRRNLTQADEYLYRLNAKLSRNC